MPAVSYEPDEGDQDHQIKPMHTALQVRIAVPELARHTERQQVGSARQAAMVRRIHFCCANRRRAPLGPLLRMKHIPRQGLLPILHKNLGSFMRLLRHSGSIFGFKTVLHLITEGRRSSKPMIVARTWNGRDSQMGSFSVFHWVIVLAAVLLLFGTRRLPQAMGDIARGMKQFRTGLKEDPADTPLAQPPAGTAELPRA
jgi:sec-independent protein translocase protein TatA